MTEEKKTPNKHKGRPKKAPMKPLVERPTAFEENEELQLTEMQNAFVWHYVNDSCTQTEAARRAGFEFPAHAATRLMNARKNPNVTKAIMLQKAELAHKFAITPEKTAKMLWQISEEAYKKGQFNASVSAIRELNELAGLKVKKTENLNITASLDKMSHKDIEDRLKQIFGGDIVDAEFKDV